MTETSAGRAPAGESRSATILLFVVVALGAFGYWNAQRDARAETASGAAAQAELGDPLPPGWGAFVIGAPSGVQPLRPDPLASAKTDPDVDASPETTPAEEPNSAPRSQVEFELSPLSDFELVVPPGQVLSRIVQVYYGAAEPALIQSLAEYNGLSHPDHLRAGATIHLPSERRLRALAGGE